MSQSNDVKTLVALVSPKLSLISSSSISTKSTTTTSVKTNQSTNTNNDNTISSFTIHNLIDPRYSCYRPYLIYKYTTKQNNDDNTVSSSSFRYQLCELTKIGCDISNSNNSSNNNTDEDNDCINTKGNYQSFLISSNRTNNNNSNQSSTTSNNTGGGSMVVQDGSLYTITPVDPLFWFLRDSYLPNHQQDQEQEQQQQQQQQQQQWQPLLQFVQDYDPIIVSCIQHDIQQYQHLLKEMKIGGTDDNDDNEIYVKFSVEKTLVWLQTKQQCIERYLLEHQYNIYMIGNNYNSSSSNSAFASGFTFGKKQHTATKTMNAVIMNDENQPLYTVEEQKSSKETQIKQQIYYESIQLVCNYLSHAWQEQFLEYLKVDYHTVFDSSTSKQQGQINDPTDCESNGIKRSKVDDASNNNDTNVVITPKVDWNMSLSTGIEQNQIKTNTTTSTKIAPNKSMISAGAKRLLKVNQRGLQSVSSFFGGTNNKKGMNKK